MNGQPNTIPPTPGLDLPSETALPAISDTDIAIIGMAGRFPDADSVDAFWQNLRNGHESVRFFSDEELKAAGVPSFVLQEPSYVKAGVVLDGIDSFDANFFGFSPREAEMMDPQHRLFLEQAWTALEQGGYTADQYDGAISVYAGVGINTYVLSCLYPYLQQPGGSVGYQAIIRNDKDFLPTLVSYKLNLKGPSVSVQTACSTSLVAVHMACQSLLNGECDMALAGAASLRVEQTQGYLYEEGMILSPDGHCRAFDAQAQGTVGGSGVATVLLKRLGDALDDGDTIHAVIKGSAINNDGNAKVGYTAPSVSGQAAVIAEAQAIAGVHPKTISYVEAHGTGTVLGDPIELAALTQAFQAGTTNDDLGLQDSPQARPASNLPNPNLPKQFCALGSVKTNIGHLDTAAGLAGLIKTTLALRQKQLPPSLHFNSPNPAINFSETPFYVNTELTDWQRNGTPRRAGVSAFGIGGTNAHVVMEEAPSMPEQDSPSRATQLIGLSAKTPTALATLAGNLANHLKANPDLNLADVAFTLNRGRKGLDHRRSLVAQNTASAISILDSWATASTTTARCAEGTSVTFMFSGQGSQYVGMGQDLYQQEPVFREVIDRCATLLKPILGEDIRGLLYPTHFQSASSVGTQNLRSQPTKNNTAHSQKLSQTAFTQPALFMVEYALAQLWMSWGIRPQAMVGHSIGEYVAACLAGVFSLEDALRLVATRGQLMQSLPAGSMLAIAQTVNEVQDLLKDYPAISLATVNGPSCVVSGPTDQIEALQHDLEQCDVDGSDAPVIYCRRIRTSHAFHSAMMDAILLTFTQQVQAITLNPPTLPYLSNVSGTWISEAQATDPHYWAEHLRQTVQFAPAVAQLLQDPDAILLEVGPGRTLSHFVKQHPDLRPSHQCFTSLRHPKETRCDQAFALQTLGSLWSAGLDIDWRGFYQNEQRRRLPLPTYPFERQRYWIEADATGNELDLQQFRPVPRQPNVADWLYVPSWQRSQLPNAPVAEQAMTANPLTWLIFVDDCDVGRQLAERLQQLGQSVWTVVPGSQWEVTGEHALTLNPDKPADFDQMIEYLQQRDQHPTKIIHGWTLTSPDQLKRLDESSFHQSQRLGLHTLISLAQSLGKQTRFPDTDLIAIGNGIHQVTGDELTHPAQITLLAPIKVLPLEYPHLKCRSLDIVIPTEQNHDLAHTLDLLLADCMSAPQDTDIAYRGRTRWTPTYIPAQAAESAATEGTGDKTLSSAPRLRPQGVYLITGGTGGVGLSLAYYLAHAVQAKLVLVKRSAFLPKDQWQGWLTEHGDDDSTSKIIRRLQTVEAAGGTVQVVAGDVTNLDDMRRVVAEAEATFGPINGAIHCAGLADKAGIVQGRSRADSDHILASKIQGTLVLKQALSHHPLDIFVLSSSLSATLYKTLFGQVAYCAANDFLDAFAAHQNNCSHNNKPFTLSIDWTEWLEVGMAVDAKTSEEGHGATAMADHLPMGDLLVGIKPTEGQAAFDQLLRQSAPRVVVSTQDLNALLKQQAAFDPHEFLQQFLRQEPDPNATQYPRPSLSVEYIAPGSPLESFLAELWQSFLGIQPVGIEDNFFELGGDSLSSLGLTTQLQQKLAVELPSNALLDNATISTLIAYLKDTYPKELETFESSTLETTETMEATSGAKTVKTEPESTGRTTKPENTTDSITSHQPDSSLCLLRLRQGDLNAYSPLFFVHPIGGGVACYTDLLRYLEPQRPFYGLRAAGINDGQQPHTDIPSMARDYIAAIKTVQPEGPYNLGGWSMGGVIAYEMAQQLGSQGSRAVIMVDSPAPIQKEAAESSLSQLLVFARSLNIPDAQTQPLALSERFRHLNLAEQIEEIRRKAIAINVLPESFGRSHMLALYDVFKANDTALKQYVATRDITSSPMLFVRGQDVSAMTSDFNTLGWQQLVGSRLRVSQAPGDHYTMVEGPQAQVLGNLIETYLQSVQAPLVTG
ncbi:MAG: SDR family oxidoreductase [Cyanobacteria bacterium J06598_3]